jgi:hypothetical protein
MLLPTFSARAFSAAFLLVICSSACAARFDDRFAVVLINAETEARYGQIPLKRSYLARALRRIADAGGKGVVLKFFLDQNRDKNDDAELAAEIARVPVVLQARMDDGEAHPNLLPGRFILPKDVPAAVEGNSGWIPMPAFARVAADIGFVDMADKAMPLVEHYQGRPVKSLALAAIELAESNRAHFGDGAGAIQIGRGRIRVDKLNRSMALLRQSMLLRSIAFHDLLEKADAATGVKGKVVIIAYDGPHIPTVDTSVGRMGTHLAFIAWLRTVYDDAFADVRAR